MFISRLERSPLPYADTSDHQGKKPSRAPATTPVGPVSFPLANPVSGDDVGCEGAWLIRLGVTANGDPRAHPKTTTGNYRIIFGWSGENAPDIDFEDYH